MNNTLKTILLFGSFVLLFLLIGRLTGNNNIMWGMALLGIATNIIIYFISDKIAIRQAGAIPLKTSQYPEVQKLVTDLAEKANLPNPRIFLSPQEQPNAFATGRSPKKSAIVLNQGLIRHLNQKELEGVIAHEISHIKNRDILIATVAAVLASLITSLTYFSRWGFGGEESDNGSSHSSWIGLLMVILAPLAALLIQLAISREREFSADQAGARLAGDPNGLADALEKIDKISNEIPGRKINPAFENLYIANPLGGESIMGGLQKMFSTHPPMQERVEKLRNWSYTGK